MLRRILRARWPWFVLAALIVGAYLSTLVEITPGDPRPVGSAEDIAALSERDDLKVLFILIDTLRADRLGSYGYARDTSPTIDYLASTGVRFARHLAQSSWTKCSMASLWTGLYPVRTGVLRSSHATAEGAKLPAEILSEAGFRTAGVYRNGWVAPNFGFSQGFELYFRPRASRVPASVRRENPAITLEGTDLDIVDQAASFLSVYGQERWFLYLHLMDIHQYVYDEETALFGTGYSDVYDNAIRRENRVLDGLLSHLIEHDLMQKTLIVISSDHGEAFGERGLEGHARNVYREVTEVPLVLSFPFKLEPGIVVEARTENVDIWPTLLDLLGLPPLEGPDGRSRLPLILSAARGEAPAEGDGPAFAQIDRRWAREKLAPAPMVAVAEGDFRFVYSTGAEPREELFRAEGDALEQRNIAEEQPEVAARLRTLAQQYLESPPPPWGGEAPTVELDEMELNQLRALGYAVP
jgi:arylsulfatase A-like enzyme